QPDAKVFLSQVRRARNALQRGLADDPELTRELRTTPAYPEVKPRPRDRADYEVTQKVPASMLPGRAEPRPLAGTRTMIDAPPPAVARSVHAPSPERLGAEDERRAPKR